MMFRYVVLCLMALLNSANADDAHGEPVIESMDTEKKKKRREQNVQAAKKSYEAKKKERSDLQTKNTELYETQMKLMHDKSRLQERTIVLEHIIEAMTHQCLGESRHIPRQTGTRSVCRTTLSNNCHSLRSYPYSDIKPEPLNDNDKALDLSARATHHEPRSTKALPVTDAHYFGAQVDTKDNVLNNMDDQPSGDGHIFDLSTLGIGATQEVELDVAPRRKMRHSRDKNINEDGVFIPETKPKKSRRNPQQVAASRPARACATDAMKKQRAAALCPRDRASSY